MPRRKILWTTKSLQSCTCIYSLLLYLIPAALQQESLQLTSTPQNVTLVYRDQPLLFTCSTRGSSILAWSSDDYIGTGGIQLEFLSIEERGTIQQGIHGAYAELVFANNTSLELVSKLHINASSLHPTSSVTCLGVGINRDDTVTFSVSNTPSITLTPNISTSVCSGDILNFICATLDSPILAWSSDTYIGQGGIQIEFLSIDPNGTVKSSTFNSQTSAILHDNRQGGGANVLNSTLTVTALPDSSGRGQTIMCVNVGVGTRASTTIQVNDDCSTTTALVTRITAGQFTSPDEVSSTSSAETTTSSTSSSDQTGVIVAVVVIIIVFMLFIIGIVLAWIFLVFMRMRNRVNIESGDQESQSGSKDRKTERKVSREKLLKTNSDVDVTDKEDSRDRDVKSELESEGNAVPVVSVDEEDSDHEEVFDWSTTTAKKSKRNSKLVVDINKATLDLPGTSNSGSPKSPRRHSFNLNLSETFVQFKTSSLKRYQSLPLHDDKPSTID